MYLEMALGFRTHPNSESTHSNAELRESRSTVFVALLERVRLAHGDEQRGDGDKAAHWPSKDYCRGSQQPRRSKPVLVDMPMHTSSKDMETSIPWPLH